MAEIEIFVRTLNDKHVSVKVNENDTVLVLKQKISAMNGMRVEEQMLMFNSRQLEDAVKIKDYSIQKGSQVTLVKKLVGGF